MLPFKTPYNKVIQWPLAVRGIIIAIIVAILFLTTVIRLEKVDTDKSKNGEENIQWLVDWMKSQESQKSFNLRCEKEIKDKTSSQSWQLRCTADLEDGNAENYKQSQWFYLRLDDLKGDQNQSENSLCCRPCMDKARATAIVVSFQRYKKIYLLLSGKTKDPEVKPHGKPGHRKDCNYHSVTLSEKLEYELKRMLQYELERLQKTDTFKSLSEDCQTTFFETEFKNIFGQTLKETSLEKSTHSIEHKLTHESHHAETASQVKFTSQAEQREEQIQYSQTVADARVGQLCHVPSRRLEKSWSNSCTKGDSIITLKVPRIPSRQNDGEVNHGGPTIRKWEAEDSVRTRGPPT